MSANPSFAVRRSGFNPAAFSADPALTGFDLASDPNTAMPHHGEHQMR